jgi:hypothetical protein
MCRSGLKVHHRHSRADKTLTTCHLLTLMPSTTHVSVPESLRCWCSRDTADSPGPNRAPLIGVAPTLQVASDIKDPTRKRETRKICIHDMHTHPFQRPGPGSVVRSWPRDQVTQTMSTEPKCSGSGVLGPRFTRFWLTSTPNEGIIALSYFITSIKSSKVGVDQRVWVCGESVAYTLPQKRGRGRAQLGGRRVVKSTLSGGGGGCVQSSIAMTHLLWRSYGLALGRILPPGHPNVATRRGAII